MSSVQRLGNKKLKLLVKCEGATLFQAIVTGK